MASPIPQYAPTSFLPPGIHEWAKQKPDWYPDSTAPQCFHCGSAFSTFKRRHHCRLCGGVFCQNHCHFKLKITNLYDDQPQRVCDMCHDRANNRKNKQRINSPSSSPTPSSSFSSYSPESTSSSSSSSSSSFSSSHSSRSQPDIRQRSPFLPSDSSRPCPFNLLADHLIENILDHLDEIDLSRVSLVCKSFQQIVDHPEVWRRLYCRTFDINTSQSKAVSLNWKKAFREKRYKPLDAQSPSRVMPKPLPSGSRVGTSSGSPQNAVSPRSASTALGSSLQHDQSVVQNSGLKVVLVGPSFSGKSSLLRSVHSETFRETFTPTVGCDFITKTINCANGMIKMTIWDTSGDERYWGLSKAIWKGAHVLVLSYAIDDFESFAKAQHWMNEIKIEPSRPLVFLVGLKSDLEGKRQVSQQLAHDFSQMHNLKGFLEVSPKTSLNVSKLFVEIGNALTGHPPSNGSFSSLS